MKKNCFILLTALLIAGCTEKLPVPHLGEEYTVFEVDMAELSGLCLNKDKTKLLACGDTGTVKEISFTGEATELWKSGADMEGIALNPSNGDIYLAIEGTQKIHRLPAPVYNQEVVMFDVSSASAFKNSGIEAVEFYKRNTVFVGSQKGANLWQYKLDGTLVSSISLSSFASEIAALHYDEAADCLWVADSKLAKIFVCTVEGQLLETYDFPFIENAEDLCLDRDSNCLWIGSDEHATKLYKIDFDTI
jgi:uncharacterized protein YjiK